jgi:uncharacterized protein YlxP (DUF503 family)
MGDRMIKACQIEIYIYDSNCLKDKRRILKSIIDKLKSRYNISIAETDYNDKWNRSIITFAAVSNSSHHLEIIVSKVLNSIENDSRIEILNREIFRY